MRVLDGVDAGGMVELAGAGGTAGWMRHPAGRLDQFLCCWSSAVRTEQVQSVPARS